MCAGAHVSLCMYRSNDQPRVMVLRSGLVFSSVWGAGGMVWCEGGTTFKEFMFREKAFSCVWFQGSKLGPRVGWQTFYPSPKKEFPREVFSRFICFRGSQLLRLTDFSSFSVFAAL